MASSSGSGWDPRFDDILDALQSIAASVQRGSDRLGLGDTREPSGPQAAAVLDYLVLRELVGRQADETRRTLDAIRFPGQVVAFASDVPDDATAVAVYTRRSAEPDEVVELDPTVVVDLAATGSSRGKVIAASSNPKTPGPAFFLSTVRDDQPIVRLEVRAAERAVALGPRLSPV
jgi:hypothetical protein